MRVTAAFGASVKVTSTPQLVNVTGAEEDDEPAGEDAVLVGAPVQPASSRPAATAPVRKRV